MAKILNLGAGPTGEGDKKVDLYPFSGVTDILDLAVEPLPYSDNEFDEVRAEDVLEHIPSAVRWKEKGKWHLRFCRVALMREIYRVLKPGGIFHASVPIEYPEWAQDPTHDSVPWTERTFAYFCGEWGGNQEGSFAKEAYGIDFAFERVEFLKTGSHLMVKLRKPW